MSLDSEKSSTPGFLSLSLIAVATAGGIFHLYTAVFGLYPAMIQRSIHLIIGIALTFILFPLAKDKKLGHWAWKILDVALLAAGVATCAYMALNYKILVGHVGNPTQSDLILGAIALVVTLEITRRTVGLPLVIVGLLAIAYALWGDYIPGAWGHRGVYLDELLEYQYLSTEGLFSVALGASANYIYLFIIFGAFLLKSGVGDFFNDVAGCVAGKYDGGPAKVAVVSSAFFAMISGASVANVATTGAVTIPMMKKVGFRPVVAGAIEAAASTGGQFMPPVMGAVAFIMADMLGIPYISVCKAAALPGLLFFFSVLYIVHLEAKRCGIKGLPVEDLPDWKATLKNIYLIIPVAILLAFLIGRYSATFAAFWSIMAAFAVSALRKATRMNLQRIIQTFVEAAKNALPVLCACATAGIVIGVVTQTGLGLKFATLVIEAAGDTLWLALIFVMITCIILGMGLTVSASYIITIIIAGPVLIQLNVDPIAAHLFVVYYAVLSCISPPLALSAFAAAGLAGTPPFRTAFWSMRIAVVAYIVPFLFVYNPALIWSGSFSDITISFVQGMIACITLGSAIMGYLGGRPLNVLFRGALLLATLFLFHPGIITGMVAVFLLIAIFAYQKLSGRRAAVPAGQVHAGQDI